MVDLMDRPLSRMSRWLAVGGVGSIVFGLILLFWPGISLTALTYLFGAFAFVYGIFSLGAGLELLAHKSTDWVPYIIGGLAGVLFGVLTYLHPGITELTLAYLIAAFAFVIGVFEIVAAIDLWGEISTAIWLAIAGVLSIVFGVLVAWRPGAGLLAFVWMIAVYAIAFGIAQLVGAYRINQLKKGAKVPTTTTTAGAARA